MTVVIDRPSIKRISFAGVYLSAVVLPLCVPLPWAWANGLSLSCKFGDSESVTVPEARYDIARAYQAADLVVIGEIADRPSDAKTVFHVQQITKGMSPSTIRLVGPQCHGTACTGLTLAPHTGYLLLLRQIARPVSQNGR